MAVIGRFGTGGGQRAYNFGEQSEPRNGAGIGGLPISSGGYGEWGGGYVPMIVEAKGKDAEHNRND